jgi:hypothetical protein
VTAPGAPGGTADSTAPGVSRSRGVAHGP